ELSGTSPAVFISYFISSGQLAALVGFITALVWASNRSNQIAQANWFFISTCVAAGLNLAFEVFLLIPLSHLDCGDYCDQPPDWQMAMIFIASAMFWIMVAQWICQWMRRNSTVIADTHAKPPLIMPKLVMPNK
ncbi:MAG TPA: hypothetical protein VI322_00215, partial [Candidatus Saccharimonadia bacterium]